MHTKRFIKMELPGSLQQISCFNYALHKAGFQVNEFALRVLKFWNTPDPFSRDLVLSSEYIVFLKNRGMAQAMPPFQSNDIIVYFDDRNVARHAAVAANDKWVYAKLGNRTRHAYLHKEIETPPHYGTKFQIYRARLA
jgi:hypothetical protein